MKNIINQCIRPLFYGALVLVCTSCRLFGVYLEVHNPGKPGKPPVFSKEAVLLGALNPYRTSFKASYYELFVTLDPEQKALEGKVLMYAMALKELDTIQIDLQERMEITGLLDYGNGKTLSYSRDCRAVYVVAHREKGERFALEITYRGKPMEAKKAPWKGGFVWKTDKVSDTPWIGVACQSEGASIWWPLKDHTSEEPDSMRMHYSVPEGLTAVGNGRLEGSTKHTIDGKKMETFNWFVSYPINTYNVTLYVGKFKLLKDFYFDKSGRNLALDHYVLERNYEKAKTHFKQVHSVLKVFSEVFGPYPWTQDGYKLVESPYEGMEHQSAIAYGNGYKSDLFNGTDYIILHETAHEWWGNSVTAADLADVWIQEGFATYAEALYFEYMYGAQAYADHLRFSRIFIKNKYPLVGIKGRRWFHFRKNSDVYAKGAWVLQTLRVQINNNKRFMQIIQEFYDRSKYSTVESSDFINTVNQLTGDDYNWFFNHYLYQNEAPELEYYTSKSGVFYYRWKNVAPEFDKLPVKVKTVDGIKTIFPSSEIQTLGFTPHMTEQGDWSVQIIEDVLIALNENKKLEKEFLNEE